MLRHYFLNFLLFVFIIFSQTYFGFALIFLIFTLFYFSPWYLFFLTFLTGVVLDTLSGGFWGMNLFLLLFCAATGILLTRFLEKSNFFSRLIIGESIIFLYFSGLLIANLIFKNPNIGLIIFEQFLTTSLFYILLSFLFNKIQNLKIPEAEQVRYGAGKSQNFK